MCSVRKSCIFFAGINSSVFRLAAGGVLECVDKVVKDEVDAAWAVVRPPGHHAEVRIKKLETLSSLQLSCIFIHAIIG